MLNESVVAQIKATAAERPNGSIRLTSGAIAEITLAVSALIDALPSADPLTAELQDIHRSYKSTERHSPHTPVVVSVSKLLALVTLAEGRQPRLPSNRTRARAVSVAPVELPIIEAVPFPETVSEPSSVPTSDS